MDRLQDLVRLGRDDCAGAALLAFGRRPAVPQPGEPERVPTLEDNPDRLLPPADPLPLSYVDMSSVVRTEPSRVLPKLPNWEDRS